MRWAHYCCINRKVFSDCRSVVSAAWIFELIWKRVPDGGSGDRETNGNCSHTNARHTVRLIIAELERRPEAMPSKHARTKTGYSELRAKR